MTANLADIEACVPELRRYARAPFKTRSGADSLVHDYLVRALGRPPTQQQKLRLRPWLFATTHNLLVSHDEWRLRTRGERVGIDAIDECDAALSRPRLIMDREKPSTQ